MGKQKLKPCPFCGHRMRIKRPLPTPWVGCNLAHSVQCSSCKCSGPSSPDFTKAWEAWNKRAEVEP